MALMRTVVGFVESVYIGEERREAHSVLAGYISGLPDIGVITYTLTALTASELCCYNYG